MKNVSSWLFIKYIHSKKKQLLGRKTCHHKQLQQDGGYNGCAFRKCRKHRKRRK